MPKYLIGLSSEGDLEPTMHSSLFNSMHPKMIEIFPGLLERWRRA